MSDCDSEKCLACQFSEDVKDLIMRFMDAAQTGGTKMPEAGSVVLNRLAFLLAFETTTLIGAAHDPDRMLTLATKALQDGTSAGGASGRAAIAQARAAVGAGGAGLPH